MGPTCRAAALHSSSHEPLGRVGGRLEGVGGWGGFQLTSDLINIFRKTNLNPFLIVCSFKYVSCVSVKQIYEHHHFRRFSVRTVSAPCSSSSHHHLSAGQLRQSVGSEVTRRHCVGVEFTGCCVHCVCACTGAEILQESLDLVVLLLQTHKSTNADGHLAPVQLQHGKAQQPPPQLVLTLC